MFCIMNNFDPSFVTLVTSGWSFSSVSCHLYQHSFIFYSGPFFVSNFLNFKQALGIELLIFFCYCTFDSLGQIQSRNFLLMFICVITIHHIMDPAHPLLETFQITEFGEVSVGSVLEVGCVWNEKIPDGPDADNGKYFSIQEETWDWTLVVKCNEIFGNSVFCPTGFTTLLCWDSFLANIRPFVLSVCL